MENKITKISKDGVEYPIEDAGAARATDLASKQDALNSTQLTAVNSGIDSTKVAQIETNRQGVATNVVEIDQVKEKIPAQASASNQLADKQFVNSSIQTQTAHFRGNWEDWNAVPTDATEYPVDDDGNHEPTTNDYMVVQDASGFPVGSGEPALAGTWRFKYSGTWTTNGKNGWLPEYQVNETPLTSAQLAALNSGITDTAVTKLNGIEAGAEVNDINSISVNGTTVTPDVNKNVNLTINGGVKTLTTADYNYPADNPTSVALWLLPVGFYKRGSGATVKVTSSVNLDSNIAYVGAYDSSTDSVLIMVYAGGLGTPTLWERFYRVRRSSGLASDSFELVAPINDLTTMAASYPLSANQGRILNNKIEGRVIQNAGAPTTSTVGTVGILLEDTTNGKLYQCTAIDNTDPQNIVYTWTEVGGGSGGGITTLTTADYNYPTTGTKTAIALWLLEPGYYRIADDAVWRPQVNDVSGTRKGGLVIVGLRSSSTSTYEVPIIAIGAGGAKMTFAGVVNNLGTLVAGLTDPSYAQYGGLLSSRDVQNNLTSAGSSASYLPLSANQGRILNEKIEGRILNGRTTAPTTSTVGTVGTQYNCVNDGTPEIYICTDTTGGTYTWTKIN